MDTEGDNYTPLDITEKFEPTQETFHAVVTLEGAPSNIKLGSMWYLVQASGYVPNFKIDENILDIAEGGSRNVDFTLSTTQDTWPSGTYCVEIYAEGNSGIVPQLYGRRKCHAVQCRFKCAETGRPRGKCRPRHVCPYQPNFDL